MSLQKSRPPRLRPFLAAATLLATHAHAQESPPLSFRNHTLEQLGKIEVTSPSKRPESSFGSAAAITRIGHEDIQRSGLATIGDLLRLAPGMQVGQLNANQWAISSRGFAERLSNKMLVLVDGRNVYSQLFAGTFWENTDYPLDDIDRIEVIRGPGGTLWGANAVNGVVNITSLSAFSTQGGLLRTSIGSLDEGSASLRYGGKIDKNIAFRIYGSRSATGDFNPLANGDGGRDSWTREQAGFRLDWAPEEKGDSLTLQGDLFEVNTHSQVRTSTLAPPYLSTTNTTANMRGANLMVAWEHKFDKGATLKIRSYWDYYERDNFYTDERAETLDLDAQFNFSLFDTHRIVAGLNLRHTTLDFVTKGVNLGVNTPTRSLENENTRLLSAFLQDEITLVPDHLTLTLGAKFEYTTYGDSQWLPSLRLAWTPSKDFTVWFAASRALRPPNFVDKRIFYRTGSRPVRSLPYPLATDIVGNPNFEPEELIAIEAGVRWRPSKEIEFDLSTFRNSYNGLSAVRQAGGPALTITPGSGIPYFSVPIIFTNESDAVLTGFELSAKLKPKDWWLINASYSYLDTKFDVAPGARFVGDGAAEEQNPRHQWQIRSYMDLKDFTHADLNLDIALYGTSEIQLFSLVPSHTRLDIRLAWKATKTLEIALVGQNLLDPSHPERGISRIGDIPSEIPRSVHAVITYTF